MDEAEKEIARNMGYLEAQRMRDAINRTQRARLKSINKRKEAGTYIEPTPEQLANPDPAYKRRMDTEQRNLDRANEAIRFHTSGEFAQQYAPPPTTKAKGGLIKSSRKKSYSIYGIATRGKTKPKYF